MQNNNKQFLIGLLCGGIQGADGCDPLYFTWPFLIVDAQTPQEAVAKYNKATNASYFYGNVMCQIDGNGNCIEINDLVSKHECQEAIKVAKHI